MNPADVAPAQISPEIDRSSGMQRIANGLPEHAESFML